MRPSFQKSGFVYVIIFCTIECKRTSLFISIITITIIIIIIFIFLTLDRILKNHLHMLILMLVYVPGIFLLVLQTKKFWLKFYITQHDILGISWLLHKCVVFSLNSAFHWWCVLGTISFRENVGIFLWKHTFAFEKCQPFVLLFGLLSFSLTWNEWKFFSAKMFPSPWMCSAENNFSVIVFQITSQADLTLKFVMIKYL